MVVCTIYVPDGVDDAVCRSVSFKLLSNAAFAIVVWRGREASSSRYWARLELGVVVVG